MSHFDRYLRKELLWGYMLAAVVLVGIFSLVALIEETGALGKGDYGLAHIFYFVAMTAPGRFIDLLPLIVLMGSTFALGMLASNQELVAARALGAANIRITRVVLTTALLIIAVSAVAAEWAVPELEEDAHILRAARTSSNAAIRTAEGFWARDGLRFVNIDRFLYGRIPQGIDIYEFDAERGLVRYTHARSARIRSSGDWQLQGVLRKHPERPSVPTQRLARAEWQSFIVTEQIGVLSVPPESLAPSDLFAYVSDLNARGESSERYALALWRSLAAPIGAIAMALLAVPVATTVTRQKSGAQRVFLAAAIGLVFYLLTRALGFVGLLADVNPALTTVAPFVLLALIALLMLRRQN